MKRLFLLLAFFTSMTVSAQKSNSVSTKDQEAFAEIKRQMDYELTLILKQDTAAMKKLYPDDFVVTNPFSQFIDKKKVLERVASDIIKYTSYEKKVDYYHIEGNLAVVIGSEIVVPTLDANREDAGKTVNRRFTEVWVKRGQEWKRIVRHASNIIGP